MTKEEIIDLLTYRMNYYAEKASEYCYLTKGEKVTMFDGIREDIYSFVADDYKIVLDKIKESEEEA